MEKDTHDRPGLRRRSDQHTLLNGTNGQGGRFDSVTQVISVLSIVLWVVAIGGAFFLYMTDKLLLGPVEIVMKEVCGDGTEPCASAIDVISVAVQLGRLDFVSVALAVIGTGVGLFAIFSFAVVKKDTKFEARLVAQSHATETAISVAQKAMAEAKEEVRAATDHIAEEKADEVSKNTAVKVVEDWLADQEETILRIVEEKAETVANDVLPKRFSEFENDRKNNRRWVEDSEVADDSLSDLVEQLVKEDS